MLMSLFTMAVLVYVGWVGVLWVKQDTLIFPRHLAGQGGPEATIPRTVTRLWLAIDDPKAEVASEKPTSPCVEAWLYMPPDVRPGERGLPVVVFAHGNGELVDSMVEYAEEWMSRGYAVLMPEYRGYGRSSGAPSEHAIVADYARFVDWLLVQPWVDEDRLVYHGRSLGTGVVVQVAALRAEREGKGGTGGRPGVMVLESPFLSIARMAGRFGAPGFVVRHPFRTDAALPGLAEKGTRVVILHSPEDEIVPYSHGTRLARLTPGARLVDLSGSHMADLCALPAYWEGIDRTLEDAHASEDRSEARSKSE